MRRLRHLLFWFCAAASLARAQSIQWDPPGGSIAVGQAVALRLICRDCEPTNPPVPPKVPDLVIDYQGPSSSIMNDNGVVSQTFAYNFAVLWPKNEPLILPAFDVPTNRGTMHVPSVRFEPAEATVGSSGKPLSAAANAQLIVQPPTAWAGQVVQLEYRVQAESSYRPDFAHQAPTWNPDTLVAEEWAHPEAFESHAGGDSLSGLSYRTRVIAPRAGTYQLRPATQLVSLSVGLAMFGFFQSPQFQQYSVPSAPVTLEVRELPPAPPGFSGAVGSFRLTSKVVPLQAGVKEPITWTLELSGTGNWPQITSLPVRAASRDFQVVHPQLQHSTAPGKIFDAKLTEDVVLVPTKAGRYVLPPVNFVYFDPYAGQYRTVSSEESAVVISAPPGEAAEGAPAVGAPPSAHPALSEPALPHGLPRDPLSTGERAGLPLAWDEWAPGLAAPFLIAAALWLTLAWKRAQLTDPLRPRREARRRLVHLIDEIRRAGGGGAALRPMLLAWQKDAARWRSVRHAAPAPAAYGDPAWSALAGEVDGALYGPDGALPADWPARAEQALAAQPSPKFRSAQLFLPRNLFPFFLLAALCAAGSASRAADPAADYRAGDFAAAERGWRTQSPVDPAVRHNLSLALAQQDRWPDAAAEAAAAFVQDPDDPVIRGQFATACERAGVAPGPLTPFLDPTPWHRLVECSSPADWQRESIAAAAIGALGAALWLAAGYGALARRWIPVLAAVLVAIGAVGALVGVASWLTYGTARDESAVWVVKPGTLRSIPTEAAEGQAAVTLPAGSIGAVDKTFLGWERLRFPNGTTGWVRRGEVVSLWK